MSNKDNDKSYSELYESLGVEPGLLSKTDIGKTLNEKYKKINKKLRDDAIDAKIYAHKIISDFTDKNDNKPTVENSSPLYNTLKKIPPTDNMYDKIEVTAIDNSISDELWKVIRAYQLSHYLSNDKVISEIKYYLDNYNKDYTIIRKEEKING